jgi:glutamate synthase (NADPH/NADH) small chain
MNIEDYMQFTFMCKERPRQRLDEKVAIIGGGPSGLAAAGYLACKGYGITIFERLPFAGGMMVFGIPEFRIPRKRVLLGCKQLEELFDAEIKTSWKVSANGDRILGDDYAKETAKLQDVTEQYDATIISTGAWISKNLPGEGTNVKGIYSALEYLFRIKACELDLMPEKKKIKLGSEVAVIGAGLVAVDAALEAVREGCNVHLISIENLLEAPAGAYEINRLKRMKVKHTERAVIKRVFGQGKVESIELVDVDAEVKAGLILRLEEIPGTQRIVNNIDNIVTGIGQIPTPPFKKNFPEIRTLKWGGIEVNDQFMSTKQKVFAAGDVATGASKVGRAFQSGLKTAYWVDRHLQGTA